MFVVYISISISTIPHLMVSDFNYKIAVVTLQTFDLLTVSLGKLKFASVTDFSLAKLPRRKFISSGLSTPKERKDFSWIPLDSYPKVTERENKIPR